MHDYGVIVIVHVQHAWKGGKSAYKMVYRCTFNGLGHILDTFISVIQTEKSLKYNVSSVEERAVWCVIFISIERVFPVLRYSTLSEISNFFFYFLMFILNFIA